MSQAKGFVAEKKACEFLQTQGLKKLLTNYRCKQGEIDLIMQDKECLVFVEVKARKSNSHGYAIESISALKRKKIVKTAIFYLMTKKWIDKYPIRFDAICFDGNPPKISWVKNAFTIDAAPNF